MKEDFKPDVKKIAKERREILEKISEELASTQIPAEILKTEAYENGPEILTVDLYELGVEHDETLGEFYFMPLATGDDKTGFFNGIITLTEELEQEHLDKLYEAISILNFHMLSGSFGVSQDKRFLSYKLTIPYPLDMEKEELYSLVNCAMGNAVTVCDQWVDIVLRISEGKGDVQDVMDIFGK